MTLGLETPDHLLRVHPQLNDLQCHRAANRLFLLCHENGTEAAFTNLVDDLVATDLRPGSPIGGTKIPGFMQLFVRRVQEGTDSFMGLEQIGDLRAERVVVAAFGLEKNQAGRPRVLFERRAKQLFNSIVFGNGQ